MKQNRLLFLFFLFMCMSSAFSYSQPDTLLLKKLNKEVYNNESKANRLSAISRLLTEARKQQNKEYEGNALFLLTQYYYSNNVDSMFYWANQAIPLFRQEKRYEDMFRIKAWTIYNLTRAVRRQEALDSVNSLLKLAKELNYPEGAEMANQALADYYISNDLKEEGTQLYEEVLAGMEKRHAPLVKRVNIVRQLINKASTNKKCIEYLGVLNGYIEQCEEQDIQELDEDNPLSFLKYLLYRSYTMAYMREGDLNRAFLNLTKTEAVARENKMESKKPEIMTIYAFYYNRLGQYDKSILLYDTLLAGYRSKKLINTYISTLGNKAITLMSAQRYKEAAMSYKEISLLNDSLSKASYYESLAELKTQHDVDKLQLEKKEMEVEALQSHNQMLYLFGGVIVLSIICCLLGYLVYTVHRFGRQLKVAKEKAEDADRLKSAFLANMNHEIRTPLNAIVGFSQILVDEEDPECRQQYFSIIQNNNELLQRLIYDVLDLSKIESNTMAFNYKEVELLPLMNEIYSATNLRMPEGVVLELKLCTNIVYHTDRFRLTQILTNLLNNAIKHTEKGFIRLGYELVGTNVLFSIEDSGEGIPEDKLDSIFSRFVQLNDWHKGVGLGLAICQGLIAKMGGTIGVTSKVGEGTIFTVCLPLNG